MKTVAVVGLGQIGGSLCAALKSRRVVPRVLGVARRPSTAREALRRGIVHEASLKLEAIQDADLVVLATPVRTLLRQIPPVCRLLKPGAILTDVGSTKARIVRTVPRGIPFVPGHPLAGSEKAGLDGLDPDVFVGRPWVLLASPHRPAVARLVRAVGARPLLLRSAEQHDRLVAECSHLPHVIAYALMSLGADLRCTGRSFRDATRVALSDPDMVLDFLITNARLRDVVDRFAARLRRLARSDEPSLRRILRLARRRRAGLH